jgi:hypothetical protein
MPPRPIEILGALLLFLVLAALVVLLTALAIPTA